MPCCSMTPGMIASMTQTTIKLPVQLRDTLKQQAARHRRTLGNHLAALAAEEERRLRFADLATAMQARPADEIYRAELRHWTSDEW